MIALSDACCVVDKQKIVQRSEQRKIFRIMNPNGLEITVCRVDGCLLDGADKKCDFLFSFCSENKNRILLVELKGVAHVHALRQIIATAEQLRLGSIDAIKESYIVCSSSPKAASTYQAELRKLQKRFIALGLNLPIKANNLIALTITHPSSAPQ